MAAESEMSIGAFIDNRWFRGSARVVMMLGFGLCGWITAQMQGVDQRTGKLEEAVAQVQSTQALRAQDSEDFQTTVDNSLSAIRGSQAVFQSDLITVKTDIATVKGMLQALIRRDDASNTKLHVTPPSNTAPWAIVGAAPVAELDVP